MFPVLLNPFVCDEKRTEATFSLTAGAALFLSRLGWQHRDLGAGLLDKLLQVNLSQLLGQQLQLMLHVLQGNTGVTCEETRRIGFTPTETRTEPGSIFSRLKLVSQHHMGTKCGV